MATPGNPSTNDENLKTILKIDASTVSSPTYVSKDANQSNRDLRNVKIALYVSSALYIFLFSGAFFGYAPMKLLLEKHGAFSSLCAKAVSGSNETDIPENDNDRFDQDGFTCNVQTSRLLTLLFLAQFTQFFSPLLGALSDRYTPASLMALTAYCALAGLTLLLVFVTTGIDKLLYIAFPLNGIVAMSGGIMYVNTGMMFEEGAPRNRVLSSLSSLFDARGITYLGLWAIEKGSDITFQQLLCIYIALEVGIYGIALYCWVVLVKSIIVIPETKSETKKTIMAKRTLLNKRMS